MKQSSLSLSNTTRRTRKGELLDAMAKQPVGWHVGMRPGLRRALDKDKPLKALIDQLKGANAGIRTEAEHRLRVVKQQLGYVKVRYRGHMKNTAQIVTLFALSTCGWQGTR